MNSLLSKGWYYTKNLRFFFQSRCIVLIYHRVEDLTCDPQLLAVSPENFERQITYLKNEFNIISLQTLVHDLNTGRITDKTVVITFDDGYADNLLQASSVLLKYNVPATVFVSSAMVGADFEFWWDSLEAILLSDRPEIKRRLSMEVAGKVMNWNIQNSSDALAVYHELHALLKDLPGKYRGQKIDELHNWSGIQRKQRPSHATLSKEELKTLASLKGIEIGAHTVSHPRLSNETHQVQREEIVNSKYELENIIGKKIYSFSYPFGKVDDFTDTTVNLVRQSGYACGIANFEGTVNKNTNLYMVPRRIVRNWTIEEFKTNVDSFFKRPESWVDIVKLKSRIIIR